MSDIRHLIEEIRYIRGVPDDASPMTCSCGWSGLLWEWDAHKHPDRPAPASGTTGCRHGHPAESRFRNSRGWLSCRDCHQNHNRAAAARQRTALTGRGLAISDGMRRARAARA